MRRLLDGLWEHERGRGEAQGPLGRYEILGEIKRGGMGVVHRAWDRQLGRPVALKVIAEPAETSPEVHARFLQEAQLGGRLTHPNIVPIFDTGSWQGKLYLAMQLVDGTSVDQAPLDIRGKVAAARDVARALDFAHRNGVVHRDVKPSNILVDREGRVYVTDFGIARRTDAPSKVTLTGAIMGTPCYMSPEQARGEPADPRSDVYSLGATLYELLTGRPPFYGADSVKILLQVRRDEPARPKRLAKAISRDLETIVLKAMDKSPDRRYQTAEEFALDLERYLMRRPIEARRRSSIYRLSKWLVRHRWRIAAAFLGTTLAGLGGLLAWERTERTTREAEIQRIWKEALSQMDLERALGALEEAKRLADDPRFLWSKGKWADLQADVEAWQSYRDGRAYLAQGEVERAIGFLSSAVLRIPRAQADHAKAHGRFREDVAQELRRCEDLITQLKYKEAEAALTLLEARGRRVPSESKRILEEAQRLKASLPDRFQTFLQDLESCREHVRNNDFERARTCIKNLEERISNDVSLLRLAGPHFEDLRGEYQTALFEAEFRQLEGKGDPRVFRPIFERLAGPEFDRVKERDKKLGRRAFSLAEDKMRISRYAEAVDWFTQAEAHGVGDAELYKSRGLARIVLGNWKEAEADYQKYRERAPGGAKAPAGYGRLFIHKARGALDRKDWQDAFAELDKAITIDEASQEAWYHHGLARFASGGPAKEALSDLQRSLECEPKGMLAPSCRPDPRWDLTYRTIGLVHVRSVTEVGFKEEDASQREASWHSCRDLLGLVLAKVEPESVDLLLERARMSRRLRDYSAAMTDLEKAGDGAQAFLLKGQLRYLVAAAGPGPENPEGLREALAHFSRVLDRRPPETVAYYWRAVCREKLGLVEPALDDLKAASSLDLSDVAYLQAVLLKQKPREAFAFADRATKAKVLSEDEYVAGLYEHRGLSVSRATKVFLRNAYFARAKAAFDQGIDNKEMYQQAAQDSTQAITLDGSGRFWWALHVRAKSLFHLGRYPEAVLDLENVLRVLPDGGEYDGVKAEARALLENAKRR